MDEETTAVGAALHTQPALVVELDQIAVSQNSPFLLYIWGADRFLPYALGPDYTYMEVECQSFLTDLLAHPLLRFQVDEK